MTVSMQLSAVNNIFKAVLKVIQEIRKLNLEEKLLKSCSIGNDYKY